MCTIILPCILWVINFSFCHWNWHFLINQDSSDCTGPPGFIRLLSHFISCDLVSCSLIPVYCVLCSCLPNTWLISCHFLWADVPEEQRCFPIPGTLSPADYWIEHSSLWPSFWSEKKRFSHWDIPHDDVISFLDIPNKVISNHKRWGKRRKNHSSWTVYNRFVNMHHFHLPCTVSSAGIIHRFGGQQAALPKQWGTSHSQRGLRPY